MDCIIICTFDNESQRWTAASDDKYGLVLESNSLEALMERVKIAMPDMLEFTCNYTGPVTLHFKAERITLLKKPLLWTEKLKVVIQQMKC